MILNDGKKLSSFGEMYVVAEVNTSHFGKFDNAKLMIDRIAKSGCDSVKFQSWDANTLNSKSFYSENPIARRMYNKLSLTQNELKKLSEYSRFKKISFSSTAYSYDELDFLINQCSPAFLKIASMDIVYHEFIKEFANSGLPVVLSTGMASRKEIDSAVEIFAKANNPNLCILHCVSLYPAPANQLNLLSIQSLIRAFPDYIIGYSDHSTDSLSPVIAYSLGAAFLERHFTLDNSKIGFDNQMASEPWQFTEIKKNLEHAQKSMGHIGKNLSSAEIEQRNKMRRSICYKQSFKSGHILQKGDFVMKRPGLKFSPNQLPQLLNNTLIQDVDEEQLVSEEHFKT
jgi:N-acetylneuraminate synthase